MLEELRSRTRLLLAASLLAASFLGREAFEDADWGVVTVLAVMSFLASIAASVYVLLPKKGLVFSLVGSAVFERLYAVEGGMAEVHRRLAYDLDRFWEENDRSIQRLLRSFEIGAAALVVEVLALVALIADTLSLAMRAPSPSPRPSGTTRPEPPPPPPPTPGIGSPETRGS